MIKISSLSSRNVTMIIMLVLALQASAQKREVDAYFSALRNKQAVTSLFFEAKKEDQYIAPVAVYLQDTVPSLRVEAYYLLSQLGNATKQKNARKRIVSLLIHGWHDKDQGIQRLVDNGLTHFHPQDFDRAAIDSVRSRVEKLPANPGALFKLVGYLQLQALAPKIKSYVEEEDPGLRPQDRWAGYIALARLGDQQAVDVILNRIRTFGVNDDAVYELFPDLIYTRSYRAIQYLEEVLFSNERNCGAPSAESRQKMTCAYRVMELLAPVIKDYPVTASAGGGIATNNYAQALETTRAWFTQRKGTYEIIRDAY
jgi:hypothetical protein